jgi:hypothetical protein
MSVNAKFTADFSTFTDAVNQADAALTDFGKGAVDVEAKLNRMTDSVDGRAMIQQATLMAEAIDQVGGAATLTEKQLSTLGAKAEEAVAKMQKLGLDVPEHLQQLADASKAASDSQDSLGSHLLQTAAAMAAGVVSGEVFVELLGKMFEAAKSVAEALPDIVEQGAKFGDVQDAFQRLTDQAGLLATTLLGTLRAGTHGTVTDFNLMKDVNRDLAAGMKLTQDQFGILAQGAFALGKAMGGDAAEGFNAMSEAMAKGTARGVAELTGKVDLKAAEERYAQSLNQTAADLAPNIRLEVDRQAILQAVAAATARVGEQTDNLADHAKQAAVSWTNFRNQLGEAIANSPVLLAGLKAIDDELLKAFGPTQADLIRNITGLIDQAAIESLNLADVGISVGGFLGKAFYDVERVVGELAQGINYARLALLTLHRDAEWIASWADLTGLATKYVKELDASIDKLNTTMDKREKSLDAMAVAQQHVDDTTEEFHNIIQLARTAMVQAAAAQDANTGATDKGNHALKDLNLTLESNTTLTTKQWEEMQKLLKAWDDLMTVGTSYQDTLNQMDQGTRKVVETLLAEGASMASLATVFGLTASQQKAFTEQQKELAAALALSQKDAEKTALVWDQYFETLGQVGATAYQKLILAADKWRDDQYAKFQGSADDWKAFADGIEHRYAQMVTNAGLNLTTLSRDNAANLTETAQIEQNTLDYMLTNWQKYSDAAIQTQIKVADAAKKAADDANTAIVGMVNRTLDALSSLDAAVTKTTTLTLPGTPGSVQEQADLASVTAQVNASPIGLMIAHGTSNLDLINEYNATIEAMMAALGYAATAAPIKIPGRADGGPVFPGSTYVVGEQGPELFRPATSGTILPNGMGGSVLVQNTFHIVDTEANITRRVSENITRSILQGVKV